MPPFNAYFDPMRFGIEFVYSLMILILCFMIFLRTREMYELTGYKGIRYFRHAFFFLGLAYLSRFFLHLLMISRMTFDFFLPMRFIMLLAIVFVGYFSTMAIFNLVYSTMWKLIRPRTFMIYANLIAIMLSLAAFFSRTHIILISLQVFLLIFVVVLSVVRQKTQKKHSPIMGMYVLLLVFWIFNLYIIGPPKRMLPPEIGIMTQVISLIIFFVIYHKVSKWTR